MNFSDAIKELNKGCKVRRGGWEKTIYLKICDMQGKQYVTAFNLTVNSFNFDASIIISEDWKIDGSQELQSFEKVVDALQLGKSAKLSSWDEQYIMLDKNTNQIVFCFYEAHPFTPTFDCFRALDWSVVD